MQILFVGGGSIGHLAPAVAVWRAVEVLQPSATMHFVCSTRSEDAEFLQHEHIPFTPLCDRRFSPVRPDLFFAALSRARRILNEFHPDVIFAKGGAVSVPVCLIAWMRGIPIVLHESDAVMGRANRLIARWATTVCLGMSSTQQAQSLLLKAHTSVYTGNPVRPNVTMGDRERGLALTGLSGTRPILLVMGGSQGAATLNAAVTQQLPALLECVDVVHLTGKGKSGAAAAQGYWTQEIAYDALPDLYAIASLALSRSGAGSISELAANGIPSLLVPLRGLAQDHQLHNALVAEHSGGARYLPAESLHDMLVPSVRQLSTAPAELERMGTALRTLSFPQAAQHITTIITDAAQHKRE